MNNDWRSRLKAVIEKSGHSLPDVANMANYDYVTFWKALVKEKHNIKRETMDRICKVLNVDPDYIWYGKSLSSFPEVPVLYNDDLLVWLADGKVPDARPFIGTTDLSLGKKAFAWRSQSMDMSNLVPENSIIYFDPDRKPETGDFVMAYYRDGYIFRRYVDVADEQFLMAVNSGFPPLLMGFSDKVLAVATGFYTYLTEEQDVSTQPYPKEKTDEQSSP